MMQWSRLHLRPMTLMLAIANIVGVALCFTRLWNGSEATRIMARPPPTVALPSAAIELTPKTIDATLIRDAALFHESRSFYVAPVGLPMQPPPDYRLSGTVVMPKQPAIAVLVQSQSGARIKVHTGDTLEGWQVESIEPRVVMLRLADRQFQIRATPRPRGFR